MMPLMPFDEINALTAEAESLKSTDRAKKKDEVDKYIDEVTDLFVVAYVFGNTDLNSQLGSQVVPDPKEMQAVIEEKFDGKTYKDRIREYMEDGTVGDIKRVLETDVHRIYNAALYTGARQAGATRKTWNCMMLPTSRDTHIYLDGTTIPIDAEFYSFRGGKTMYPGQWGIPEEDCNCLCWLTYSKE